MLNQETQAVQKLIRAIDALRDAVNAANETEGLNVEVDISMSLRCEVED